MRWEKTVLIVVVSAVFVGILNRVVGGDGDAYFSSAVTGGWGVGCAAAYFHLRHS